ncbi:MAG: acetyl-CoA acetyltransferase [Proteobacteria bacterium]|nr:acetyl-CoA acetyltransferase [Pseudomonadota bacterium]
MARRVVIVGAGQAVDRIEAPGYRAAPAAELAARAARAALTDCGADCGADGGAQIGIIAAVRTFEDSGVAPSPFGKPDAFPLAVARRLGISPGHAILGPVGGDSPAALLVELGQRIAAGEAEAALLVSGEAMSSTRHLMRAGGPAPDWAEHDEGPIDDRGVDLSGMLSPAMMRHGLMGIPAVHGLYENARRARLGLDRAAYAMAMGELFAPFSALAAANPFSCAAAPALTAAEIATPGERNRMVADPYPVKLIARDQVNQGAALLVMAEERADALGIDPARRVYLHGAGQAAEPEPLARGDLGAYPAADAAIAAALGAAGRGVGDVARFDFYSCFPIAVSAPAIDGLGLAADDPRGLTVTGGLPYFGGPGNAYALHALASMVVALRAAPGGAGLVGANGGLLSKYAALVLSTAPADWPDWAAAPRHAAPVPALADMADGPGRVETYAIQHAGGAPGQGWVLGRLGDGRRFLAQAADPATLAAMAVRDPLGAAVEVTSAGGLNRFSFAD